MSSGVLDEVTTSPFARAHEVVDDLTDAVLDSWTHDELLAAWRDLERVRNRLAAVEHRFVAQAETRGLPFEHGAANTATFVRGLLRLHPHDASARARAAADLAPRTTITGDRAPAPFAHAAAAQVEGSISPRHAAVIIKSVNALHPSLQVEHGDRVERELTELAAQFDPKELGVLATRMTTHLDQDGALADVDHRERRRDLSIHQRPDGSATITGELTAECTERLLTVMDALAAPKPAEDGTRDPRPAGQRRHDALMDALDLLGRAQMLPDAGGISTTVILTTTRQAWDNREGCVTTGHGAVLPVREAIRIAGTAARITTVELDGNDQGDTAGGGTGGGGTGVGDRAGGDRAGGGRGGGIVGWTDSRRLFTESQRLAMIARDGGCSFPGCDTPPAWCQAAHITDHTRGGPTTVDNGTLLCGHHHRNYERLGWHPTMIHNKPAWIPPTWLDPDQRSRTNPRP